MKFFDIMLAPFAECLVLVGIHAFLGLHVLRRRIIFVDLALAQIAALGTTVGIVLGIADTNSVASFAIAMGFTFVGAAVFAVSRMRGRRVPQEAVIGLVYAITAAVGVLVVGKIRGVEHMVNITHGRLLWVQWSEVGTAAVAYLLIGIVHLVFYKRFKQISDDPEAAFAAGVPVRLWDFIFYMTFGYVISFSVPVAGVLLVFVFLVAPAIIAFLVTDRFRYQLIVGWVSGTIVSTVGIYLSWTLDTPCGPTVVAFYGVSLVLIAVAVYLIRAPRRLAALGHVGAGMAVLAVVSVVFYFGGTSLAGTRLAQSKYGHAHHVHDHGHDHDHDQAEGAPEPSDEVQSAAAATAGDAVAEPAPAPAEEPELTAVPASEQYKSAETCLERMTLLQEAVQQEREVALELTYLFLADGETMPFCRTGAIDLVREQAGNDFGLDPELPPVDNRDALRAMRLWLDAGGKPAASAG